MKNNAAIFASSLKAGSRGPATVLDLFIALAWRDGNCNQREEGEIMHAAMGVLPSCYFFR